MNEKLIQYFTPPKLMTSKAYSIAKSHKVFIGINLIVIIVLLVFSLMNYASHKLYAGHIDTLMIPFFLALLFYNRQTGNLRLSVNLFVFGLVLIFGSQHLIAPDQLYSNLFWGVLLPIAALYMSIDFKHAKRLTLFSGISFALVVLGDKYFSLEPDFFSADEILQYNLSALILSFIVARGIIKRVTVEEGLLKQKLNSRYQEMTELAHTHETLLNILETELKKPIGDLIGKANSLVQYDIEDKAKESIEKSVRTIHQIFEKSIELKNVKTKEQQIEVNTVELKDCTQEALKQLEDLLKEKNILVKLKDQGPVYIKADRLSLINSVINNFMTNAIKFSHRNQVIDIEILPQEKTTILKIRDYGVGIPPELEPFIFNDEVATTRRGTNSESGTGLGLPLAKLFIDQYGANIQVRSLKDKFQGTEFIIEFQNSKNENGHE
jgi:signal transduction histidine kinase